MSVDALVDVIHHPTQNWTDTNKAAFEKLFGAPDGRFPKAAEKTMTVRAPEFSSETGVPFAAYIHAIFAFRSHCFCPITIPKLQHHRSQASIFPFRLRFGNPRG